MSIDTAACRRFVADFQKRNPQIEDMRFDELEPAQHEMLADPKNWRRQHKVRPSASTDQHEPRTCYGVYADGQPVNDYAEHQTSTDAAGIAWERRFDCKPFDGQVAYLILETHDGQLLFGEYVGD